MNSIAINFVDCAIIVLYLIFIIWWGLRNGKSSDAGSYFLAGRTMPWWIVGLSLFAASISSTTLIGQSGDAYHTGVAVFNYNLTGVVVMVFFATFLLPLYIRSGIFTIFSNDASTSGRATTFPESASWATSFSMRPGRCMPPR